MKKLFAVLAGALLMLDGTVLRAALGTVAGSILLLAVYWKELCGLCLFILEDQRMMALRYDWHAPADLRHVLVVQEQAVLDANRFPENFFRWMNKRRAALKEHRRWMRIGSV